MQACEVCGWDTRAGARVCSACRLERGGQDVDTTAAVADPNGSSLLRDLLSVSDERAHGGGTTTTAVRAPHADEAGAAPPAEPPHVNGTAGTVAPGDDPAEPPDEAHADTQAADVPTPADDHGDAVPTDDGVEVGETTDDSATAPLPNPADDPVARDEAGATPTLGPVTGDGPVDTGDPATAADAAPPAAAASAAPQDEQRGARAEGDGDAGPTSMGERLRTAFRRTGGWTGVAQLGLLLLGMLCVFQIVVLVVVNRFLTQTASATVTTADALSAHAKVTGTMFPALAVFALIVAVFAGARSADDSGRGGIHRRIAGLPSTLWAIVAAATAFLTMGLLDAAGTAAQARDVTLRAMVVCAVLGIAAFVAPRGFVAPEPIDDDAPDEAPRTPEGRPPADDTPADDGPRRMLARATPEAGPADGSGTADDSR